MNLYATKLHLRKRSLAILLNLLAFALVATDGGVLRAQTSQSSYFSGAERNPVYQQTLPLVDISWHWERELIQPAAFETTGRALPKAQRIETTYETTPQSIALAGYQEEIEETRKDTDEETDEETTETTVELDSGPSWFSDPVISFSSAWLPVDVDHIRLGNLETQIKKLQTSIDATKLLDERVIKHFERTKKWYQSGIDDLDRISDLKKSIQSAPEKVKQLQDELAKPLVEAPKTLDPSMTLEAHEALLQDHLKHEEQLRNRYEKAENRIGTKSERIAKLAADEGKEHSNITEATEAQGPWPEDDLSGQIEFTELQSKILASKIALRQISLKRQSMAALDNTQQLDRDLLKRQWEHAQTSRRALAGLIATRRDEIVRAEAELARKEAADAHPIVRQLAEQIARLAEQRETLSNRSREIGIEQNQLSESLDTIIATQTKFNEHVEAAGHTQSVGTMLRGERKELRSTDRYQQRLNEIEATTTELALQQLEAKEDSAQLDAQEAKLKESLAEVNTKDVSVESLLSKANALLARKRTYLHQLRTDHAKYLTELLAIRKQNQDLLEKTTELRAYIDKHVLWIRSAEPLYSNDLRQSWLAIQAIGKTDQWQALANTVSSRLFSRWPILLLIAVGLSLVIGMRLQLNRRLRRVCSRRSQFRLAPLFRSLLITVLQASFLPAVVATLGWLLHAPYDSESMRDALSRGLLLITPQLFIASWIYRMSMRGGLAESHFGWTQQICDRFRSATATIALYCLPLLALTYTLEVFEAGEWHDSLGRIFFIGAMTVLSVATFRLLRGIGYEWKHDPNSSRSFWEQTFPLWAPVLVIMPIALACVSALGYMYSSVFLGRRLLMTWWMILGAVSVYFLLARITDIGHNIIVARRRWKSGVKESESNTGTRLLDSDATAIREQVNRLLHVTTIGVCLLGAFTLWHEAIPAIKVFDYGLWQIRAHAIETIAGTASSKIVMQWITVADVLKAFMILVATFFISRNLPGLLQMIVLDRLPLDRGGKYAISIVCRYILAAIGLAFASYTIGFTWSSVQWLVAAMGVGLGFGLQEIFANFVAGIIILFERPIRVGDFVTVNGVSGTVTRIQLRATTVEDFDRRELIVPNKKFITDDVINWTLTDTITRVVVPVGIAYGSDTRLAQSCLLRIARQNRLVLSKPAPDVIFGKFGDSCLDFELRVHIENRESFPEIVHQLHMAIDEEFRKQEIEIAFPQQDINVKGLQPLVESLNPRAIRRKKAA